MKTAFEGGEPAVLDRDAVMALRAALWSNPSNDTVSDGFALYNVRCNLPAFWYCGTYHTQPYSIAADMANTTSLEAAVCYVTGFAMGRGEPYRPHVAQFLGLLAPANEQGETALKRELALYTGVK